MLFRNEQKTSASNNGGFMASLFKIMTNAMNGSVGRVFGESTTIVISSSVPRVYLPGKLNCAS